jgi:hypothetical protein
MCADVVGCMVGLGTPLHPWYHAAVPRRGRILAIKWGMNPNSSSLGVDVTFLLVGSTVLAMVTPIIGALLRGRLRRRPDVASGPMSDVVT